MDNLPGDLLALLKRPNSMEVRGAGGGSFINGERKFCASGARRGLR